VGHTAFALTHEDDVVESEGADVAADVTIGAEEAGVAAGVGPFAEAAASLEHGAEPASKAASDTIAGGGGAALDQKLVHGHGVGLFAVGKVFPTLELCEDLFEAGSCGCSAVGFPRVAISLVENLDEGGGVVDVVGDGGGFDGFAEDGVASPQVDGVHCHRVVESLGVEGDYRENVVEELELLEEPHKMDSAVTNCPHVFGRLGRSHLALDDSAQRRADSSAGVGWKTRQEASSGNLRQIWEI